MFSGRSCDGIFELLLLIENEDVGTVSDAIAAAAVAAAADEKDEEEAIFIQTHFKFRITWQGSAESAQNAVLIHGLQATGTWKVT